MQKRLFFTSFAIVIASASNAQLRPLRPHRLPPGYEPLKSTGVYPTELKPVRLSAGIGFLFGELKGEFRLSKNQSISGNLGLGINFVDISIHNNFNRFNGYGAGVPYGTYNRAAYLNYLEIWPTFYAGAEYRHYFKTRSKYQFKNYPYTNSGLYVGFGIRVTGKELKWLPSVHSGSSYGTNADLLVLPTTKYTLVAGFQREIYHTPIPIAVDLGTGIGLFVNHSYTAAAPALVLRAGMSVTLYSKYYK